MANNKITIDDFFSNNFELFAIHTVIEDFKLAYFLNKNLEILLYKNKKEVTINSTNGLASFSKFTFEDNVLDVTWTVIKNKSNFVIENQKASIFFEDTITLNLIPELKLVDYFLKIDNTDERFETEKTLKKLNKIKQISTVYSVDINKIKSINNLIF